MSETCEHFNGTAPFQNDAEKVWVQKESMGFCMDDGGVMVFDGDEEKKPITVAIAGRCKQTNMAVTRACFGKYCGEAPSECPYNKND